MTYIDPKWDINKRQNEADLLKKLISTAQLDRRSRAAIQDHAAHLVTTLRQDAKPAIMELFLAEYGLSTDEGVALMCLAEALLRVPDAKTIDKLIKDKIAPSDWSAHLGHSTSPLINASTWGLFLTGRVLENPQSAVMGRLHTMIARMGEPVIRTAVSTAMRELGRQFVLGQDINAALKRAAQNEQKGYCYSYDMLGEAAITARDAERYAQSYQDAIAAISKSCHAQSVAQNPGISIKLSALHPRYEVAQADRVLEELVPIVVDLARRAKDAGMGLNIDAEEADRLALSMAVITRVLADPNLRGWDGFGVVVQAYGRRAMEIIETLDDLAIWYDQRLMVRLVKGAYWDTEIKHAQVEGLADFPVFTQKSATDVSYLACARLLLKKSDRLYPQFATHNAHSVAAVLHMAKLEGVSRFEFQRLHGMGESLHHYVKDHHSTLCRIYAPVGPYRDLLAYLVRRLLENGANSSFVNQIVDHDVPVAQIAACPIEKVENLISKWQSPIKTGARLFAPERQNAMGFDLNDVTFLNGLSAPRQKNPKETVQSIIVQEPVGTTQEPVYNPATGEQIGVQILANTQDISSAFEHVKPWDVDVQERCKVLLAAADLYEIHRDQIFTLLMQEAGKTLGDSVAELREAVDFLRYYAISAQGFSSQKPRGIFAAISPWNFPLAIFTGQIAAALATGNAVIAKPAETTPFIAALGVKLLHQAGVPKSTLQLLLGHGSDVGAALCSKPNLGGVVFTGSTQTARTIQKTLAQNARPGTPFIAETGGLNAMIVDSTALAEQAVGDIVASAFQSAGQRCSALRCLYVQRDVYPMLQAMLQGAMDQLKVGDPSHISTDVGPVITPQAQINIGQYIQNATAQGRVLHHLKAPEVGNFIAPVLIEIESIRDLEDEVFGPVLHICTFTADEIDQVIEDINSTGFGLTFGLHTRIDGRVQEICDKVKCGNLYVNRNQIGAIVGSQPFGGEGLSGTGPKAGGPHYLARFVESPAPTAQPSDQVGISQKDVQAALLKMSKPAEPIQTHVLPGPTGESNTLSLWQRDPILCLGPGQEARDAQCRAVSNLGGLALPISPRIDAQALVQLTGFGGVLWWGDLPTAGLYAQALAQREGAIIPLITDMPDIGYAVFERHLCVDTTAAGGNADLLAAQK